MSIQKKLNYPLWQGPYFVFKCFLILLKLGRSGVFSLIVNNDSFNKKTIFLFKLVDFIFYKKKEEHVGSLLLKCLTNLGPGFIKFGQALSTRPDLIGVETCEYLKKLQDDIKPFPGSIAKQIIEAETKESVDNIFSSFEEKPIASASVAQVHKAIFKNGEIVAVKILRPNIEKLLFNDFRFFYWFAKCLELCVPNFKRFKLSKNVEVLSEISLNELDLTMEAAAAEELSENFKDHLNYKVPKIYWEITSTNVLVLEYVDGIRIDDLETLKKNNHNIRKITETGTEVFFLQVFRDGFFHGDMHPGNILINDDGILVPIDFGIMGRLSNKDRQFLALLLVHLLNKNYKKVVEIHSQANMLGENISHDHLAQAIRAISTPILNKPIGEVSLAKLLGQILTLSKEFNIEVQPQFTLLQKTMLMAEGTTRQINPNINMWNLSRPLIEKWINEADDPFKIFEDWVQKNKLALLKIPELIEKFDEFLSKKMN
ncbi:2-polyprenylphenol 6-hydroxylase [Alphaproteobacteria bacterium]|nr:2-polyprenylphenol 6-hydroxylase [Alphaproteobacteria bacterium]